MKGEEAWTKIGVGTLIGITVVSVAGFISTVLAAGDENLRQDAEIQTLRRDVERVESGMEELRQLCTQILREVKR